MMRGSFLMRMLMLIILTVLLCGLFTASLYMVFTQRAFSDIKSRELSPRARAISDILVLYSQGQISTELFRQIVMSDGMMWDSTLILINADGQVIASARQKNAEFVVDEVLLAIGSRTDEVLSGSEVSFVGNLRDKKMPLLIVGAPAMVEGKAVAAVFLVKPLLEINTALSGLNTSLIYALLITTLAMVAISYFGSNRIVRPLKHMSSVAMSMAAGNFSMRAETTHSGEIGQLGASLNFLSQELSKTISALQLERNRLAGIIDSMNEGLVATDRHGNVTLRNPAMQKFAHADAMQRDYAEAIQSGRPATALIETEGLSIRRSITPIIEEDGSISGALALFQDVSEQEKLEKMRREYVANVSHELRTPLTAMQALIEPLRDGLVPDQEKKAKYYDIILRETTRLAQLINDLLELSRLQSGKVDIRRETLPIKELLEDVVLRHEAVAAAKGIRLRAEAEDTLVACGNEDRVEQVLVILMDNAIKFTDDGGSVLLSAREEGGNIVVSVKDDGAGIAPDDIDHVFERFYKADKARSGKSTGLGLSIAKEILSLMGESIRVISEEGKGAEFLFTLRKSRDCRRDGPADK